MSTDQPQLFSPELVVSADKVVAAGWLPIDETATVPLMKTEATTCLSPHGAMCLLMLPGLSCLT